MRTIRIEVAALVCLACAWSLMQSGKAAPPATRNLAENPGFEQLARDGRPAGWTFDPAVFQLSDTAPHSGRYCLRFESHDPKVYRLCTRTIKLQPGRMYEIAAWVRTDAVRGEESGASLCIEWHGADGKWLGGSYPPGIAGTHRQWTRVRGITTMIPQNAARFTLSCYLRKGMVGTAWWDDIEVRPYYPPMLEVLTTDAYRNTVWGGPLTVDVGLGLKPYGLPLEQWTVQLAVFNHKGALLKQLATHPRLPNETHFKLDTSSWAPGTYELKCHVVSGDGRHRADAQCTVIRTRRMPDWKVRIDRHGRVIVAGKPFFPLGMYWGGVSQKELDIYAKGPFNCLMPYSNIDRAALDRVHRAGIKVIYSVKDLYANLPHGRRDIKTRDDEYRVIKDYVTRLKDHPAILAWYINDELPLTMRDQLTRHREWLEQLDPDRPTWVVLWQVNQVRSYLPTFDIIGTDPYPIPNRELDMPLQWTRKTRQAVFGHRAIWMVPQVFNWARYKKTPAEKAKCRAPTLPEMRCMAWQCIAGGANGLVFYSWFDLWRMKDTDPFEQRWQDVVTMGREIKQFIPILLSVDPLPSVRAATVPERAGWRLFQKDESTYLLAVNAMRKPLVATWKSDTVFRKSHYLLGNSPIRIAGDAITVKLAPMEVLFIQLSK